MKAFFAAILKGLQNLFTANDGESLAPGRIMAAGTWFVSEGVFLANFSAAMALCHAAGDFGILLMASAGYQAVTNGTCLALVMGMAPADPGGAFWKGTAPPPPATPTPAP